MQGHFLLFKNIFNIDQFVFGPVRGLANLLDNLMQYSSFNMFS